MRQRIFSIISIVVIFASCISFNARRLLADYRTWSTAKGDFSVVAEYVRSTETHVELKRKDGPVINVPISLLSKNDRDYLELVAPSKPRTPEPSAPAVKNTKPANNSGKTAASSDTKGSEKITSQDKSGKADTIESVDKSFQNFDLDTDQAKLKPMPLGSATDFTAIVKELIAPVKTPEFKLVREFDCHIFTARKSGHMYSAILAAGGEWLANIEEEKNTLHLWNLETGKESEWACGPLSNPRCWTISPYGKYAAIGRDDGSVEVYDIAAKKVSQTFKTKTSGIPFRVAFNWTEAKVYILLDTAIVVSASIKDGKTEDFSLQPVIGKYLNTGGSGFRFEPQDKSTSFRVTESERVGFLLRKDTYLAVNMQGEPRATKHYNDDPGAWAESWQPIYGGIVSWNQLSLDRVYESEQFQPGAGGESLSVTLKRDTNHRGRADTLSLDRRERFLWSITYPTENLYGGMADTEFLRNPLSLRLPRPKSGSFNQHWISAEKRRYVASHQGKLYIYELENFSAPPSWKRDNLIKQALLQKRYDFLDGLFQEFSKIRGPVSDSHHDSILAEAVESAVGMQFYVNPHKWQQSKKHWLDQRKDSYALAFVIAKQLIVEGWAARGQQSAAMTSAEGTAQFRRAGELADKLLQPILKKPQPPAYAFALQADVFRMIGASHERHQELARRVVETEPTNIQFHEILSYSLLPRWFGKPGESAEYAESLAKIVKGDEGEIIYGRIGLSLSRFQAPPRFVAETEFDPERITLGLLKDVQKNPDDSRPYQRLMTWHVYLHDTGVALSPKTQAAYTNAVEAFIKLKERYDWNTQLNGRQIGIEISRYHSNKNKRPAP